ncbi:unnamed protein product [Sordaria macrospora k-hell]|uniref:WGS project CABT00000000 data, contig 2.23 n=1 Tax=Sordaria macrospora (strain ATCC MYA-333 / DSM 997 / K(L3346) / K-hell) TaxID=771870 RepID=F7W2X6_SORMK|nr:uncharacterized protein SMAC_02200 [Sordaria macrospora k-hell]CCC11978.1 unnamed protein product [Sordaria macrospora k-hell]
MSSSRDNSSPRPSPLRTSRSFTRLDPPSTPTDLTRPKRASTIQSPVKDTSEMPDTFESRVSLDIEPPRSSIDLEGLPIELVALTDSFIDGLVAKVHPTPPNIDSLSQRFQDFYSTAASHIQTHIDSLATRQKRDDFAASSSGTRQSAASILRQKASQLSSSSKEKLKAGLTRRESEMLTPEEYAERRKARKALEQQRILLEEAVERRLCEGIYGRIYRHHTTQDEAQDDKLRSKTAALAVVGIGPSDLGVDIGDIDKSDPEAVAKRTEEVKDWLEGARKELVLMNQSRYPLGKLNHLKAAHKAIIDTLSHFHPSSSADELMPMLIFTLITLPPDNLNVISDVNFIQRFRWEPKLVGESSYCLTCLEAAISFLETVDLSTLRADEAPTGPAKTPTGSSLPRAETFPPAYSAGVSSSTPSPSSESNNNRLQPPLSRHAVRLRDRRLSDLVTQPAQAFNAASDTIFTTADQSLKTIGISLGDSYKFLVGKLREHQEAIVPKTLEDARKLIGTPPPALEDDGNSMAGSLGVRSAASSVHTPDEGLHPLKRSNTPSRTTEDRVLSIIGGRKASSTTRDNSVDSASTTRSVSGSGKRLTVEERAAAAVAAGLSGSGGSSKELKEGSTSTTATATTPTPTSASAPPASSNPALIDSVRNLGSSLNPMARFSQGISGLRSFGRTTPSTPSTPAAPPPVAKDKELSPVPPVPGKGTPVADGGLPRPTPALPPKETPKVEPPIKRFMEIENPADLRIGEVLDLLRDYRRLAGALKDAGAFKE